MKKDRGGCVRKERGETAMHLKEKKRCDVEREERYRGKIAPDSES